MDNSLPSICVAISKIRTAENPQIFSGPRFSFGFFRIIAVFVAEMIEKGCSVRQIRKSTAIMSKNSN
jgi:hypothetical protein